MNILKTLVCLSIIVFASSCSDEDPVKPIDDRSFTTKEVTDFFINSDGSVDLTITGSFTDSGIAGKAKRRGFVYGKTQNPEVSSLNTGPLLGSETMYTVLQKLDADETYYVRGFFEMNDGSFFYGNEIQVSTKVDAKNSRSITMVINSELFFKNSEGITPELDVTAIEKESPVAIGFEYSVNQDFSNSSITLDEDMAGNIFVTTYSEFIENLTPNTVYHFRPYAKYADGTVTNGGASTAKFTRTN